MIDLTVVKRPGKYVSQHPLSPGIRAGDFVFLAGVTAVDLESGKPVEGGIEAQAEKAFDNMEATLKTEGIGLDQVVKVTAYLPSQADLPGMNAVYRRRFKQPFPARATVIVSALVNPVYRLVFDAIACVTSAKRRP